MRRNHLKLIYFEKHNELIIKRSLMPLYIMIFALVCFSMTERTFAIQVELSDFSTNAIIINFDTRPDGTSIPGISIPPYSGDISNPNSVIDDEYLSLGVVFESIESGAVAVVDPTGQLGAVSSPNVIIGTDNAEYYHDNKPIYAHFFDPVSGLPSTTTQVGAFSIDVDVSPVSFIAYDLDGNEVDRTFFSVGGNGSIDFAGLRHEGGIAKIAINVPSTDWIAIDDFIFEPVAQIIPEPCEGDFDHDGDVDGSDLAIFAADFGRTDCPSSQKQGIKK